MLFDTFCKALSEVYWESVEILMKGRMRCMLAPQAIRGQRLLSAREPTEGNVAGLIDDHMESIAYRELMVEFEIGIHGERRLLEPSMSKDRGQQRSAFTLSSILCGRPARQQGVEYWLLYDTSVYIS
jgi:hypothetical protein